MLTYDIQQFSPGTLYSGLDLVDLDNDGTDEVIIGHRYFNQNRGEVEVWKYNPTAETLEIQTSKYVPGEPHDLKAADFDGDGLKEIVVAGRWPWGPYYVDNNEQSGWEEPTNLNDPSYTWQILDEDFDGDGNMDFFQGVDGAAVGRILYGNGDDTFTAGPMLTGKNRGLGFTAVDVNDDGRPDLIGMQDTGSISELTVYLNQSTPGSGAWSGPQYVASVPGPVDPHGSPSAADINGDGYIDAVTLQYGSSTSDLVVFDGGANLTWTPRVLETLPGRWFIPVFADVNDDGNVDIAVGGAGYNDDLLLYLGDGGGGFTKQTIDLDHGVGTMNGLAVGDIDGDGLLDIVGGRGDLTKPYGQDGFEVLFNTINGPPTAVEDDYEVEEDTTLTIAAPGVLANDTDPEDDPLTALLVQAPSHGTVELSEDGGFEYTPNPDFFGEDSFIYKANDGLADSNNATVALTIISDEGAGVDISLTNQPDTYTGTTAADVIRGLNGDDVIDGGRDDDSLIGQNGDDHLIGGIGNDNLIGENGNDILQGGPGNDLLNGGDLDGGQGNDSLTGGTGKDVFVIQKPSGVDTITDYSAEEEDSISIIGFSKVNGREDLGFTDILDEAGAQIGTLVSFAGGEVILDGYLDEPADIDFMFG